MSDGARAAVKRIVALYLFALAPALAIHLVVTPLYLNEAAPDYGPWLWFNPFTVAGAVLITIAGFLHKRAVDARPADEIGWREYFEANLGFYLGGALTIAVFWNWFTVQWGPSDPASPITWIVIDTGVPLLALATGRRLWREAASAS